MANKKNTSKKGNTSTKKVVKAPKEEVVKETLLEEEEEVKTPKKSTSDKKEKTNSTILIIVIIIVALIAVIVSANSSESKDSGKEIGLTEIKCDNETDSIEQDAESNLPKVSCNGYEQLVKEEKDNLILIARPTCSFCQKFVPILEEIVDEYGITVNYFDTDTLSETENEQFYNSSSLFKSNDFGTPTLIITNNNKITKYTIGYKEKDATISWFKDNGIIN